MVVAASGAGVRAIGLIALAAGLWFDFRGLLLFGVVFLVEELYETCMVEAVINWGRKQDRIDKQE